MSDHPGRFRRDVAIVLITGSLTITAAVSGVYITVRDSRAQSESDARGTARLMQVEYERRIYDLRSSLCRQRTGQMGRGAFPRVRVSFLTDLSIEDRREVASRLSEDSWNEVALDE